MINVYVYHFLATRASGASLLGLVDAGSAVLKSNAATLCPSKRKSHFLFAITFNAALHFKVLGNAFSKSNKPGHHDHHTVY